MRHQLPPRLRIFTPTRRLWNVQVPLNFRESLVYVIICLDTKVIG